MQFPFAAQLTLRVFLVHIAHANSITSLISNN